LNFNRTGGTAFADTAFVTLSGTATQGEDYTELPVEVIFPPGVSTVSFPVTFPIDADGFENLIIQLGDVSICNGGFSTVSFTFSIAQGPSVFALGGDATIPCGGSTVLTPIVTGGYLPYTFLWDQGQITEMITVSPTAPTTFRAVITDDCGNTTEASFDVDLAPPTALNMAIIGPSTVTEACETTSVNIIRPAGVQGDLVMDMSYSGTATNGIDFNWPTTQTIGMDLLNVVIPFEPLEDGEPDGPETAILTASYTDACGRTVSASVSITIVDAPPIVLQTMDQVVDCGPDSLAVTVDASGGFGSLDLSWNTGDQGPITYVPIQTGGTYIVTATDDCGRTASAQAVVDVDCVVIIPNVFSPNGDGRNDRFDIDGILGTKNTVRIYNRWGQVVYEANNYQNNWSAVGVPDGTYYYEVIIDRESKPYTGHVTILR
jgi:gliding motility-associated-like protein